MDWNSFWWGFSSAFVLSILAGIVSGLVRIRFLRRSPPSEETRRVCQEDRP